MSATAKPSKTTAIYRPKRASLAYSKPPAFLQRPKAVSRLRASGLLSNATMKFLGGAQRSGTSARHAATAYRWRG
jgi:hypothetical protein